MKKIIIKNSIMAIAILFFCFSFIGWRCNNTENSGNNDDLPNGTNLLAPVLPGDLTATPASSIEIALSWTDNSDNETGFKIERAPDEGGSSGVYEIIQTASSAENSFNNTGLKVDTTYHYRVCAFNDAGDSLPAEASATTQGNPSNTSKFLTQFGITWTLDKEYETGQFANGGDYWVVGPVTIISIDPKSAEINGRTKNGSMLNPDPNIGNKNGYDKESQGYDSHMWLNDHHYETELNVALDVSSEKPLVIGGGSSLVSTISHDEASHRPALKAAAILTVLNEAPSEGSFRPPYAGTDKSIKHNINTVYSSISKLAKLAHSSLIDVPAPAIVQEWFKRPWLEHIPGHMGEYIHPTDNMPEYGGNVAERISETAAWLHLDFSDEEKLPLLIGFIQCGIDFFGIIQNGYEENGKIAQWWAAGGQCGGRKWPILFAGDMLNDQEMIDIVSDENIIFQEDGQTFYVDQEAIDYSDYSDDMCGHNEDHFACGGYNSDMIGMPEWGIAHGVTRYRDTPRWETMYRQCCTAKRWGGFVLAALIMGLNDEWGHNALFDYMDRYFQYEDMYYGGSSRQGSLFVGDMWDQYRDSYSSAWANTDWSGFNGIVYDMYSE